MLIILLSFYGDIAKRKSGRIGRGVIGHVGAVAEFVHFFTVTQIPHNFGGVPCIGKSTVLRAVKINIQASQSVRKPHRLVKAHLPLVNFLQVCPVNKKHIVAFVLGKLVVYLIKHNVHIRKAPGIKRIWLAAYPVHKLVHNGVKITAGLKLLVGYARKVGYFVLNGVVGRLDVLVKGGYLL